MSAAHAEGVKHHRPNSIHVSGLGRVSVRPDKADLNLAVEVHTKTAKAAREQAAKAMSVVIDAVKGLGVAEKDIQTSYVSLSPEYAEGNKIVGYQLSNQLMVCVRDVDKAGTVIDAAVQAGGNATRVQGMSFAVDNSTEALIQARAKAYQDAHSKAEQYAKLAGVTLGRAMHINEGSGVSPAPVPYADGAFMMMKSSAPSTPVQVGEQEVSVNVDIVFGVE
ncbi:26 kDa periplasmic immunogenic protein [Crenothrix polyspora]|uniref:26 kDa periplasmic immunogenic protein n=1 Tax=Crenothrix polyspora TaxID=360316 RepID=A0A1R4H5N0_9GAMM|nr:SIMPL domain-containing protein [Crenothrix polyspora]SJM91476.1 26 kDa periplasmic immunogenic protein [Crenothrix polyspora]